MKNSIFICKYRNKSDKKIINIYGIYVKPAIKLKLFWGAMKNKTFQLGYI
jgi:hypothetical protein